MHQRAAENVATEGKHREEMGFMLEWDTYRAVCMLYHLSSNSTDSPRTKIVLDTAQ